MGWVGLIFRDTYKGMEPGFGVWTNIYFFISNKENIILFQGWAHKVAHRVRLD